MKLNEELVVRLLNGKSEYIYMTVGTNIEIYDGKDDRFVYYVLMDRNLHEIDNGKIKFISTNYENVSLKTFIPNIIRHIYGKSVSYIVTNLNSSDVIISNKRSVTDEKIIEARNIVLDMICQHRKIIKSVDIMNGEISFEDIAPVFLNNGEYKFLTNFTKRNVWTALHITTAENNKRFSMRSCINIAISRSHINYE